jgi:hypothetical protein
MSPCAALLFTGMKGRKKSACSVRNAMGSDGRANAEIA